MPGMRRNASGKDAELKKAAPKKQAKKAAKKSAPKKKLLGNGSNRK